MFHRYNEARRFKMRSWIIWIGFKSSGRSPFKRHPNTETNTRAETHVKTEAGPGIRQP